MKAFPTPAFSINDEARVTAVGGEGGMDLRDYFAAKAMQAMLSSPNCPMDVRESALALGAYATADAMMKARQA
jgi:hypothetical protein